MSCDYPGYRGAEGGIVGAYDRKRVSWSAYVAYLSLCPPVRPRIDAEIPSDTVTAAALLHLS